MKAFPNKSQYPERHPEYAGMDLRDYFAGLAMQSLLRKQAFFDHKETGTAASAYIVADAMMEARK